MKSLAAFRVFAVPPMSIIQITAVQVCIQFVETPKVGKKMCLNKRYPLIILDDLFRFNLSSYTDGSNFEIFVCFQQSRWIRSMKAAEFLSILINILFYRR